jgi:hypothetical protein
LSAGALVATLHPGAALTPDLALSAYNCGSIGSKTTVRFLGVETRSILTEQSPGTTLITAVPTKPTVVDTEPVVFVIIHDSEKPAELPVEIPVINFVPLDIDAGANETLNQALQSQQQSEPKVSLFN